MPSDRERDSPKRGRPFGPAAHRGASDHPTGARPAEKGGSRIHTLDVRIQCAELWMEGGGLTTYEIAERLGIHYTMVTKHLKQVRLEVMNRMMDYFMDRMKLHLDDNFEVAETANAMLANPNFYEENTPEKIREVASVAKLAGNRILFISGVAGTRASSADARQRLEGMRAEGKSGTATSGGDGERGSD